MRISLEAEATEFWDQVRVVRRQLEKLSLGDGQQAISARVALPVLVPFLHALRVELRRDGIEPNKVMTAVADLIANIAKTAEQSLIEAPPLK